MVVYGLRQTMGNGGGFEQTSSEDGRMPEVARSKYRDWLVPPLVIPAFLVLLVVIVSLYHA
jgi:hypothetical protein